MTAILELMIREKAKREGVKYEPYYPAGTPCCHIAQLSYSTILHCPTLTDLPSEDTPLPYTRVPAGRQARAKQ